MLRPWIIFSQERKVPVRADWLVTIVEPVPKIKRNLRGKNKCR